MTVNVVGGRQFPMQTHLYRHAIAIAVLASLLSWGGAFRSGMLDWPLRISFWLLAGLLVFGQTSLIWHTLARWLAVNDRARFVVAVIAGGITATLFSAELNWLKSTSLSPFEPEPFLHQLRWLSLPVVTSGVAVAYFSGPPPIRAPASGTVSSRLLASPALDSPSQARRDNAIAWPDFVPSWIQAQDHYLELRDGARSALVRGRMKDAERYYSRVQGTRVHRSWWVKLDAIGRVERAGRDYTLVMRDGTRVPVSRKHQQMVRHLRLAEE